MVMHCGNTSKALGDTITESCIISQLYLASQYTEARTRNAHSRIFKY